MFKVIKTGKHKGKSWKRMVNKATFVGEGFTRKPVKLEVGFGVRSGRAKLTVAIHPSHRLGKLLQILRRHS